MSAIRIAACLGLAAWLAACTGGTTTSPAVSPTPTPVDRPSASGELVLRVELRGGLLPPLDRERQLPMMSIYGDGTVFVPAEVPDFPGPAGYEFRSFQIDGALVDRIVADGVAIGLRGPERHLPQPGPDFVADAGGTVVTLVADGRRHVTTADALFESDDHTGERGLLADFLKRLWEFDRGEGQAHEADSYRVFVAAPDSGFGGDLGVGPPVAWPFDALASWGEPMPADGLTVDARCRVLDGHALADILPLLRAATASTIVVDEAGTEAIVAYRPLLPDETGCG